MLLNQEDCIINFQELKTLIQDDYKTKYIPHIDDFADIDNLDYDLDILILGNLSEKIYKKRISNLPSCLKYIIVKDGHFFPFQCFDKRNEIMYPNPEYIKMPYNCKMKYLTSECYASMIFCSKYK